MQLFSELTKRPRPSRAVIAFCARALGTITSSPYTCIWVGSNSFFPSHSVVTATAWTILQIVNAMIGKHKADPMGANFWRSNIEPSGN
jgi:hypothetical protein